MANENITELGAEPGSLILGAEEVKAIRYALLIGLDSYGEIERLRSYTRAMEQLGKELPKEAVPLHPTGSADTIGDFACALRYLG